MESYLGLGYFRPAKGVKEMVGRARAADFVAFDCTRAENAAQRSGNERCAVDSYSKFHSCSLNKANIISYRVPQSSKSTVTIAEASPREEVA